LYSTLSLHFCEAWSKNKPPRIFYSPPPRPTGTRPGQRMMNGAHAAVPRFVVGVTGDLVGPRRPASLASQQKRPREDAAPHGLLWLAGFTEGDQPQASPRICIDGNTTLRTKKPFQESPSKIVPPVDTAAFYCIDLHAKVFLAKVRLANLLCRCGLESRNYLQLAMTSHGK